MNTFIQILENENDVSIKKLKQIYRIVSKQTHPDTVHGNNESFLRLKKEYDEACKIIEEGNYVNKLQYTKEGARIELLKKLYQFSIRIYTKRADVLIGEMIEIAKSYNQNVSKLIDSYNTIMYKNRKEWMRDAKVYYANNVFIICIKQFFSYYDQGTLIAKNVFLGHRQAIEGWSWNIKSEYRDILLSLYDWLKDELSNKRFEYYGM